MEGLKLWGWLDPDHPDPIAGLKGVEAWLQAELGIASFAREAPVPLDPSMAPKSRLTARMRKAIGAALGAGEQSEDAAVRAGHTLGQSYPDQLQRRAGRIQRVTDAVAFPDNAGEVAGLLAAAADTGFRVVPRGGGTSVVGGLAPPLSDKRPVIVVDLSRLNHVLALSKSNSTVTAEAGVRLAALEETLAPEWLTLGHFPQSFHGATLGGSIAAAGAGQRSDGYGRIADNLVSARVATPSGLWTTEDFRAVATGPWLGGLVAGSEGLFGIITDATMRLHPTPEHIEDRGWLLPSFAAGVEAVREIVRQGHGLAMLRLSDESETAFLGGFRLARMGAEQPPLKERLWLKVSGAAVRPALLLGGYEGAKEGTRAAFAGIRHVLARHKAVPLGARPGLSWRKDRYEGPYLRESLMARGLFVDTFETAVPWAKLGDLHQSVSKAVADAALTTLSGSVKPAVFCHLSHSYTDGACLYFTAIFPSADDALAQWRTVKRAATEAMIASGGTVSHHHGVGADHAEWAALANGSGDMRLVDTIRRELDPKDVMAPGLRAAFP
ncbi:MAG: FAD-binding oxidoreductase [Rhizobiaceae bacterium]